MSGGAWGALVLLVGLFKDSLKHVCCMMVVIPAPGSKSLCAARRPAPERSMGSRVPYAQCFLHARVCSAAHAGCGHGICRSGRLGSGFQVTLGHA